MEEEDSKNNDEEEEEAEEEDFDDEYLYAGSDDDDCSNDDLVREKHISLDIEATAAKVGSRTAYQWQNEWRECLYSGHQDEDDCCKFFVNVRDCVVEIILDPQHPLKPPTLDICFPKMDAETTLMIRRMELIEPRKWNFCTTICDILTFVEKVLRQPGCRQVEKWTDLEDALYELGELLQVQPKCAPSVHLALPKFGQDSALASAQEEVKSHDDDHNKRRKVGLGWSAGIGYGSGPVQDNTKITSIDTKVIGTSQITETQASTISGTRISVKNDDDVIQPSKSELRNASMLTIVERIRQHVEKKDAQYVCERSTWQCAILPFIKCASPFDFEKYEQLFNTISTVANIIGDEETALQLRTRLEESAGQSHPTTGIQIQSEYQKLLAAEHVLQWPIGEDAHKKHSHHSRSMSMKDMQASESSPPSPQLIKRAMREFQNLLNTLPLNEDTAVFVRQNSDNLLHFKLLIIPSRETPYAYGCYIFSILLPRDYPNSPPSVDFQTTDSGTVRFNPNLYANGKVCLSLLGTWPGRPEEMWDPNNSNLLAVALSIQALIFTSEPYWNEPGYENRRGTPEGDRAMQSYNENIKRSCKRVAIDLAYKMPPPEFASVIKKHCDFHRQNIQAFFGSPLASSQEENLPSSSATTEAAVSNVELSALLSSSIEDDKSTV
uniref:UBC core domain-containing protein n=1 Tax=Aureoumbra lagunensis TaxID=44058 RepID=A0A7S3K4H8_9STRA